MKPIDFNLQPNELKNEWVIIKPLLASDFDALYAVASDPLLWEQHPNKDRYKKEVFEVFFEGAINSKGAFTVYDAETKQLIGTSRFYELDTDHSKIAIGYTFIARSHWGKQYNRALKKLMLNYAFEFVDRVIFHIGAFNIRSQKAITKLGAIKFDEVEMSYYGEAQKLNYLYAIDKKDWSHTNL